MAELPLLYSFRRCPYAIRARLALLVSNTDCVVREVKLSAKPLQLILASAKASVPVLILPDSRVIDESLDIMRWALARHDPGGWLAGDDAALVTTNDGPFKKHLDGYKYGAGSQAHRAAALETLDVLESRLARHANLCGDRASLTDIAILPFIRQFAAVDPDWFAARPLKHLQQWLAGHVASSLFATAMQKLPAWREGDVDWHLAM